jgi:hypothetical protein
MIDHVENVFDLKPVLHPGLIYLHPREVLADATLTRGQKRAILASWASDAASVPSRPSLRKLPGSNILVSIVDILEALFALDQDPNGPPGGKPARLGSVSRVRLAA